MPVSNKERVEKSALYPDELPGDVLRIDPERVVETNGEVELFYDASEPEDAADLPDDGSADFGWWLPVEHGVHGQVWCAAPRALAEQLLELGLGPGDSFEVTDVSRGDEQHDPYELTVHRVGPDGE